MALIFIVPILIGALLALLVMPFAGFMAQTMGFVTGCLLGLVLMMDRAVSDDDALEEATSIPPTETDREEDNELPSEMQEKPTPFVGPPVPVGVAPGERPAEWEAVLAHWKAFADAAIRAGGEAQDFSVATPALESDLVAAEEALGMALPSALHRVLKEFSAGVRYSWFLPDYYADEGGSRVPAESAIMEWSLHDIVRFHQSNSDWFGEYCPNMLAVMLVGNGDIVAIDYGEEGKEPVRYWSHDGWKLSGFEIAPDFVTYLKVISEIGAVGPEYFCWMPFLEGDPPQIRGDGEAAKEMRRILNVQLS